jgi:hypothetical protein
MWTGMSRVLGSAAFVLVIVWIIAHVLYLGPILDAVEITIAWLVWAAAVSGLVAALVMLAFGLLAGRTSPAWLRFVRIIRTAAAILGCALVVVGLLHYRDTQPHGDVQWVILGLAILAGAGVVHAWVLVTHRRLS